MDKNLSGTFHPLRCADRAAYQRWLLDEIARQRFDYRCLLEPSEVDLDLTPTEFYCIYTPEVADRFMSDGINADKDELLLLLTDPRLVAAFVLDWYGAGRYSVVEIASAAIEHLTRITIPRLMPGLKACRGHIPIDAFWISDTSIRWRTPELDNSCRAKWFRGSLAFHSLEFQDRCSELICSLERLWQAELSSQPCSAFDFSYVWKSEPVADCLALPEFAVPAGEANPSAYSTGFDTGNKVARDMPRNAADLLIRLEFANSHFSDYSRTYSIDDREYMSTDLSVLIQSGCLPSACYSTRTRLHFAQGIIDGMACELCR